MSFKGHCYVFVIAAYLVLQRSATLARLNAHYFFILLLPLFLLSFSPPTTYLSRKQTKQSSSPRALRGLRAAQNCSIRLVRLMHTELCFPYQLAVSTKWVSLPFHLDGNPNTAKVSNATKYPHTSYPYTHPNSRWSTSK